MNGLARCGPDPVLRGGGRPYGLYDLNRLERVILRPVTREYFLLEEPSEDD